MTETLARARERLLRDAVVSALSGVVLPLTALLTGPLLARVLGPRGRGEMSTVLSPIFVTVFIASMAVPDATTWALATLKIPYRQAVRTSARLILGYGCLAIAVIWIIAPFLARQAPHLVGEIRVAALTLPVLMLVLMQRYALAGQRWYRLANLERVTAAVSRLLVLVALAIASLLTVVTAVWANIATNIFAGLLLLIIVRRRLASQPRPERPRAERFRPSWVDAGLTGRVAGYGLRGWPGVFGNLVNWRLDQTVLAVLVAPRLLGYYVVAVSLSEFPMTMAAVVKNQIFAETSHRSDLALAARATRTITGLVLFGTLLGIVVAGPVVRLLFGGAFAPAVPLAQVLLLATVPFVAEQSAAAGLLSAGRPGARATGQLLAAVVTVVGLLITVPHLGPMGAALTSLTAYSVNLAVTVTIFCKVSGIRPDRVLVIQPSDLAWLWRTARGVLRGRGARAGEATAGRGRPGPRHALPPPGAARARHADRGLARPAPAGSAPGDPASLAPNLRRSSTPHPPDSWDGDPDPGGPAGNGAPRVREGPPGNGVTPPGEGPPPPRAGDPPGGDAAEGAEAHP